MRGPLAALVAVALLGLAASCGGDERNSASAEATTETQSAEPSTGKETTTATDETTTEQGPEAERPKPPPGVPRFVAGYREWTKLNSAPLPPRNADPHSGTKNVYASKRPRANGRFPYGSIVVKEARRPGADFIGLIAIMRKQHGANPEHNDWVFVEYTRDTPGARFDEVARDLVCWSCHVGARDTDYVFTSGG